MPSAAAALLAAEFATALLLLSHRSVRAGAALGGLMAAGFLAVTGSLLIRGVSAECACFDVFLSLPPAVMLGVDACLLVGCWTLLRDYGKASVVTPEAEPLNAVGCARDNQPGQASTGFQELRLPALALLFVVCCWIFIRVLPQDPLLYSSLARAFRPGGQRAQEEFTRKLREKDPPLGTVLNIPDPAKNESIAGLHGIGAERPMRAVVVLMIGPCSECVISKLMAVDQLAARRPDLRIVAVSPTPADQLKNFQERHKLKFEMIC